MLAVDHNCKQDTGGDGGGGGGGGGGAAPARSIPEQEKPGSRPQVLLPFPHCSIGDIFKLIHGGSCTSLAWVWCRRLRAGWTG